MFAYSCISNDKGIGVHSPPGAECWPALGCDWE